MNSDSILQNSNDRDTVKETLRALFPEDGLKVNCMLMAYDEEIHPELQAAENITIAWVNDKVSLLVREYGISKENSQNAVTNWAKLIANPQLQALLEQERIKEYFVIKDKKLFKCSSKLNRYLTLIESVYPECFSHQTSSATYEQATYVAIEKCLGNMSKLMQGVVSRYFGLGGVAFSTQEDISSYIRENADPQETDEDIDSLSCEELFHLFFGYALRRIRYWLFHFDKRETREICGFKPSTESVERIIKQDLHDQLTLRSVYENRRLLNNAYKISLLENDNELLDRSELSTRTVRCLERKGITTIPQLMLADNDTLSSVRNLGKKGLEEVTALRQKMKDSNLTNVVIHLEIQGNDHHISVSEALEDDWTDLVYREMQTLGTFVFDDRILNLSEQACLALLNLGYLYSEQVIRDYIYLKETVSGVLPELIAELEDSIKRPLILGIDSEKAESLNKHVGQIINYDTMDLFPFDIPEYQLLSQYVGLHERRDDLSSYFKLIKDSNDITIWPTYNVKQKSCDRDQGALRFSKSITANLITEKRLHSLKLAGKECPECGKKYITKTVLYKALAKEYQLSYTENLDDEPSLLIPVRSYNCLKRAGIKSIYDLCDYTPDDMMKIRNLGRKSLEEVLEIMAGSGISLKCIDYCFND